MGAARVREAFEAAGALMHTKRIISACQVLRAKGYRVEAGTWGVGWNPKSSKWAPLKTANKRLCPLGALVLVEQPPPGPYLSIPWAVSELLGVGIPWVIDFQCAFDGVASCVSAAADAAATVFRSLAAEQAAGAPQASGESGAGEA